jgi:hypothetical protein
MDDDEQDGAAHADGEHAAGRPGGNESPSAAIDIVQLAAKVQRLMQDEWRLEKARGAGSLARTRNR